MIGMYTFLMSLWRERIFKMIRTEPTEFTPEQEELLSILFCGISIERFGERLVRSYERSFDCLDPITKDEVELRYASIQVALEKFRQQLREYTIDAVCMELDGVELVRVNYERLVGRFVNADA